MQGYVAVQDGAFGESGKCFREIEDWMASEEAAGLQHADLEDQAGRAGPGAAAAAVPGPAGPDGRSGRTAA